jgi:DNA repair exonuclease SbcCD ATPase subunit
MIILKYLAVENFRLLREINLHFPQRGSILIQGPNEAGKSTLFESIYFALYGEPLVSEQRRRTLDDLISYGSTHAAVTLTLSIGVTEMTITRSIERGQGQQVTLYVQRLGMPEEAAITDVSSATSRIIAEMGSIDGETLRNTCLVEQKDLNRLERLRGSEREATVRKLLGLEKLTRLAEQFKVTERDELLLIESAERLQLAEIQARIPELSKELGHIETILDAVTVSEDLAEMSQQEAEIVEQEHALEELQIKRHELKGDQGRIQQLKKADAILGEIITAYDAMAEAQREIPELERQIAELDRREREELPALEHRVHDLEDLTGSFATLLRMSEDLINIDRMIRQLEQELKEQKPAIDELKELDEQIAHAQTQIDQIQQTQRELEEQQAERPRLEARLPRLKRLSERVAAFRQAKAQYTKRVMQAGLAEEHSAQLASIQKELHETEQELVLVEAEAKQAQQRADEMEMRWRQLSTRRQLEEWQRVKGLSQGLQEAGQHVMVAHEQQEQLTREVQEAHRNARMRLGFVIFCCVFILLFGIPAGMVGIFNHAYIPATILGVLTFLSVAAAWFCLQNYLKARETEQEADQRMQQAIGQIGMMVAAREAAGRMGGKLNALAQVEREIHSLGGKVPQSVEEAQLLLERVPDRGESLADIQQQMTTLRTEALTARNQVNVTLEAVAALRKECARLEEQYKQETLDETDDTHRTAPSPAADKAALERIYQEIVMLASQEGLPIPAFDKLVVTSTPEAINPPGSPGAGAGIPLQENGLELDTLIEAALKDTERALVAISAKMEVLPDISKEIRVCRDALNALLTRKRTIEERHERFQTYNPAQQIELAREQKAALYDALSGLQNSLRQRVQPLGIPYGQTAAHNAEVTARKQLEILQVTLGHRMELQRQHSTYVSSLRQRQESLSELYRQLAKFSSSLGSWIVPLNPFADALVGLRTRCQHELQEAHEEGILQKLEELQLQEGASKAKIELYRQEIEEAQERIAAMLAQRNRPPAKGYSAADIVAVWPLVGEYSTQDRSRLQEEHEAKEQELRQLEEQELDLSARLQVGDNRLDLEQARIRMELQERNYQTKSRGGLMVKVLNERLVQKVLPRTEYYMQQLVPLVTCGRYRDIRLTTDPEEESASGGILQLRVWESSAGEYLPLSALSGGTADQLSLALRLAFTIAALPRELVLTPGFMLLDEPLSSLDRAHSRALVDIVRGEMLNLHFEQVLLMSHSSEFEPAMFSYHVYMDGGMIAESNLPTPPAAGTNGNSGSTVQEPIPVPIMQE